MRTMKLLVSWFVQINSKGGQLEQEKTNTSKFPKETTSKQAVAACQLHILIFRFCIPCMIALGSVRVLRSSRAEARPKGNGLAGRKKLTSLYCPFPDAKRIDRPECRMNGREEHSCTA